MPFVVDAYLLLVHPRNAVDLDLTSAPQHGLYGGARRIVVFEELRVDLVHRFKIIHIGKVHGNLDHVLHAAASHFQHRPAWIGGTGGQGGWDMTVQLLVEVVIIAVVIYVAVRFFRRRG